MTACSHNLQATPCVLRGYGSQPMHSSLSVISVTRYLSVPDETDVTRLSPPSMQVKGRPCPVLAP